MKISLQKRSAPLVRWALHIRERENKNFLFCEGLRVFEDVLKSHLKLERLFCREDMWPRVELLLQKYHAPEVEVLMTSADVMSFMSDLDSAPGVIAMAKPPQTHPLHLYDTGLYLILDRINIPQNVGALFRVAEAAGVEGVFLTSQTCDPLSAKVIRGSSGSVFRVPFEENVALESLILRLHEHHIHILAASHEATLRYDQADWRSGAALLMSNEAHGVSKDKTEFFTGVSIPMQGAVESLNVGTAGAVLLFEALRQRRS